jgi:hypothetical protein
MTNIAQGVALLKFNSLRGQGHEGKISGLAYWWKDGGFRAR